MPLRAYSSANAHAENILGNMLRTPLLRTYLGIILLLQLIRLHRSICSPNSLAIYGGISSHLIIIRFFACCLLNIRCACSGFYRLDPTESACLRCGTINTVSAGTAFQEMFTFVLVDFLTLKEAGAAGFAFALTTGE